MRKYFVNMAELYQLSKVSTAVLTAKAIEGLRYGIYAKEIYSAPLKPHEKKQILHWCLQQPKHPVFQQSNAVLGL